MDDEPDIAELVAVHLAREGFRVVRAGDGESALEKLRGENFHLLILDLMLPGLQGTELCRLLKADPVLSSLPIIMLTARSEETDRVVGLEMGADDYVAKPFSPRELVARVKAVLRRVEGRAGSRHVLRTGDLVIDSETYTVTRRGERILLSATEFRLLRYLAERPGRVFGRDELLDAIWRDEGLVEPRTVDVHVRRLRARIEEDPSHPLYIRTRRGIGYFFSDTPDESPR